MAERLKGLTISLDMETSALDRSLSEIRRSFRALNSNIRTNMNNLRYGERSVKSYETAIESLNRDIRSQRKNVEDLRRKYQEAAKTYGQNSRQAQQLAAEYNKQADNLNRLERQLESATEDLRKLRKEQQIAASGWGRLGKTLDKVGNQLKSVGSQMRSVGQSMALYVTAPIVGVGAAAIRTGVDFEKSMSNVQALSGATGKEMAALEKQARELGATTVFSASEAAEAQAFLAMAGYDVNQIMDSMPGLLDLAAAGQLELGRAADITTNIMSGFGIEASKTQDVADMLAKAASTANTNVEQMGSAMSYVAPVAAGAGIEISETAAAIGVLSNAGIQGERAGTALRGIIASLQNPTGQTKEALKALGLSADDVNPSMHSLSEILKTLEDAGIESSQAMQLVGVEAGPALLAMLGQGSKGLRDYTKELENSKGAAEEMAETMTDNLAGDWQEFTSALEELALQIYDILQPALRTFVQLLTSVVERIQNMSPAMKLLTVLFAGLVASIAPLLLIFGTFISVLGSTITSLGTISTALATLRVGIKNAGGLMAVFRTAFARVTSAIMVFLGPVGIAVGIIGTLASAFLTAYRHSETFRAGVDGVIDSISSTFATIGSLGKYFWAIVADGDYMNDWITHLPESIRGPVMQIGERFASMRESVLNTFDSLIAGIQEKFTRAIEVGQGVVSSLGQGISNGINNSIDYFSNLGGRISDSIGNGLNSKVGELVTGYFQGIRQSFESLGGIATLVAPSLVGLGTRLVGLTGPVGIVIGIVTSLISTLVRLYQTNEDVRNFIQNAWSGIQGVFASVWQALQPIFEAIKSEFDILAAELGPEFAKTKDVIMTSISELQPTFQELGSTFAELGTVIWELFAEIGQAVADIIPVWIEFQVTIGQAIGEVARLAIPSLLSVVQAVFPAILSIIQSLIPIAVTIFSNLATIILQVVQTVLPMLLSVVQAVFPVILSVIQSVLPVVMSLISTVAQVILSLARTVLPMILSVVQAVFPMILSVIQAVLPIVATLLTTVARVILQLARTVIPLILQAVQVAFPIIQQIIQVATNVVMAVLQGLVIVIRNVVIPAIKVILQVVQAVFPVIVDVIKGALNIVIGILNFFISLFTGNWSGMWDSVKQILSSAVKIVWSVIQGSFNLIASFIRKIFTGIANFFGNIWSKIRQIFATAVRAIVDFVANRFESMRNGITNIFNRIKDFARTAWNTIKDNIVNPVRNAVSTAMDRFRSFRDQVSSLFRQIKDNVTDRVKDMIDVVKGMPKKMGDGLKKAAGGIKNGIKAVINTMTEWLGKGVNGVISGINWVLDKLGVKGKIKKWTVPQYAHGTDGHPGGLAWVGDGVGSNAGSELVMTPDGKQYLSPDRPTLTLLPKGTHVIPAKITKEILDAPQYAWGTIKKGLKTGWTKVKSGVKNVASKVKDTAVGIWEYVQEPSKMLDIALETIGVEIPSAVSTIGKIARGGFNYVKDKAVGYIKDKVKEFMESVTVPAGKGAKAWRPVIYKAAARMGEKVTEREVNGIIAQIQRESGGNEKIVQSSAVWDINMARGNPARGLLQYIPQTFRAYAVKGHNNIYSGYDQLLAFFNNKNWRKDLPYGRRGWGPTGGRKFATGGLVKIPGLYQLAEEGYPEWVIPTAPHRRTDAMKLLALAAKSIQGNKRPKQLPNVGNTNGNDRYDEVIDKLTQQVQLLTELVVSNRQIANKPVLTEGDIARAYNRYDAVEASKQRIFRGRGGI